MTATKQKTTTAKPKATRKRTIKLLADLPIATEGAEHVPHHAQPYHDHDGLLSMLMLALNENMPALVIGDTGTGKTSAIRHLAKVHGAPFRRINLNGGTTVDELTGRIMLNKDGTVWIDGALTEAMRKGYWIVLDEINACGADVLFLLHSLLDDDRMIVLTEHNGEVVRPHEAFRVFATANPTGDYAGTREMNKALLSRFPIVLNANYPTVAREIAIIAERVPELAEELTTALVKTAHGARQAHKEGRLDFIFSTRDILNTAYITARMGGNALAVKSAMKVCIAGKCSKEDAGAISDILNTHLKGEETAQVKTREQCIAEYLGKIECNSCHAKGLVDAGNPVPDGDTIRYACACGYCYWLTVNKDGTKITHTT